MRTIFVPEIKNTLLFPLNEEEWSKYEKKIFMLFNIAGVKDNRVKACDTRPVNKSIDESMVNQCCLAEIGLWTLLTFKHI